MFDLLIQAAGGHFPPADGTVRVLPSPPGRCDAVVAFSAHNLIAAEVGEDEALRRLPAGDPGAPMNAPFLTWLGDRLGSPPGMLDMVMVAPPPDGAEERAGLVRRVDLLEHPRVVRALRYRTAVEVFADPRERGIVILGRPAGAGRRALVRTGHAGKHRVRTRLPGGRIPADLLRGAVPARSGQLTLIPK